MLVVMKIDASPLQTEEVCRRIEALGLGAHPYISCGRTHIGVSGDSTTLERGAIECLPGVQEVVRASKPYRLVTREMQEENTIIRFPGTDAVIGGEQVVVIAGPCSIESRDQAMRVAEEVSIAGAQFFRGGAYKPRTSPYAFSGLGEPALRILAEVREAFGMRIVTEALDEESFDLVEQYADMVQIGARNMQNFALLRRAGRSPLPVLLKRGMSATLEELLLAAEYILREGNRSVALCERGIRAFADHSRYTLDLSMVPAAQKVTHLPVIVDPSHGTGRRDRVLPMARAAVAAGADGVMVEVHSEPQQALSDGTQAILPAQFAQLMHECSGIAHVIGRSVARGILTEWRVSG
jgi:3-deoxy-7-phosphoheptulonate synthase